MSQLDVSQSYCIERPQLVGNLLFAILLKKLDGFTYSHVQHVVDVLVVVSHVEYFLLEASAVAGVTLQHEICHELHLNRYHSSALALLAASAFGVEREVLCRISLLFCQGLACEELAYGVISLDVSGRIGTCALAYRVLVDKLHVLHHLPVALERRVFARSVSHLVQMALQGGIKYSLDERRLARTAHSRHHGQHVERQGDVYSAQIVHPRSLYLYGVVPLAS